MTNWSAGLTAVGTMVTAGGVGLVARQVAEARKTRGVSEISAYNDTRGRMDAAAPCVEVHVGEPAWPPLAGSPVGGTPPPWPPATTWHFPRGKELQLYLQALVTVTNRSAATVHVKFEGDLWEFNPDLDGRVRRMRTEALVEPGQRIEALLRGGVSLERWAEIDKIVRSGQDVERVVQATITVHDDADEGVTDVWRPWLTGTPIAEDPNRGSVWQLTLPPPFADDHGGWCLQYDMQPARHRTYWLSREAGRQLPTPPEFSAR